MFRFDPSVAFQEVVCIRTRSTLRSKIIQGEHYILDRMSIWIDSDGDAYGTFYDMNHQRVDQIELSSFRTL